LNERQAEAIRLVKEKGLIAIVDLKEKFSDITERTLNRDLQLLVQKGILKAQGKKKSRKYSF